MGADHHPGLEVDTRPHDKRYSDLEVVPDSNQTHAHGDHTTLSQNEKKSGLNSTSQPLAYDGGLEAVHPNVGGDAGAAEHGGEPGAGKSEKKSKKGTSICGLKKTDSMHCCGNTCRSLHRGHSCWGWTGRW